MFPSPPGSNAPPGSQDPENDAAFVMKSRTTSEEGHIVIDALRPLFGGHARGRAAT